MTTVLSFYLAHGDNCFESLPSTSDICLLVSGDLCFNSRPDVSLTNDSVEKFSVTPGDIF